MLLTHERSEEMKARIQAAVEDALRKREVSARRASLDVVGNDGLIRDIRAGRLPGVDRLEALFEYLGLEFYLGPRRDPRGPGFAEPAAQMRALDPREAPRAGFMPIPWHPEAAPPAGYPAAPVAFARAWLEAEGLDPARLAAVLAEAAPHDGEVLALVESAAPRRNVPAPWCIRDAGRLRLTRVQFEPGATVIFSAASEGAARVLVGEERTRLALLGRVAWSGHRELPEPPG
jgi:hypothetical protein